MKIPVSKSTQRAIAHSVHLSELQEKSAMLPEAAAAIEIADRHLVGKPARKRMNLAVDIQQAIMKHAGRIAEEAIAVAIAKTKN